MAVVLEKLPEKPEIPHRLGRHVEHDERSRMFAFSRPVPPPLLDHTVIWESSAPILEQGNLGSCTGNAAAQLINTDLFLPVRRAKHRPAWLNEHDAVHLYSKATVLDNISGHYRPDDTGSSGIGVAKSLKFYNYIDHYEHCFTWEQFLAGIVTQPVLFGTLWTDQMFVPDAKGVVSVGTISDATVAGGHEYLCRGINFEKSVCLFRNSWGDTWNPVMKGEFCMSFSDVKKLLANQGDVTVPHGVGLP